MFDLCFINYLVFQVPPEFEALYPNIKTEGRRKFSGNTFSSVRRFLKSTQILCNYRNRLHSNYPYLHISGKILYYLDVFFNYKKKICCFGLEKLSLIKKIYMLNHFAANRTGIPAPHIHQPICQQDGFYIFWVSTFLPLPRTCDVIEIDVMEIPL